MSSNLINAILPFGLKALTQSIGGVQQPAAGYSTVLSCWWCALAAQALQSSQLCKAAVGTPAEGHNIQAEHCLGYTAIT